MAVKGEGYLDIAVVLCEDGICTPVVYGTPLWRATIEWAKFHELDPNRIPAGSTVERDAARCEIRYFEFQLDDAGDICWKDNDVCVTARVERGEAPPLPFPKVA